MIRPAVLLEGRQRRQTPCSKQVMLPKPNAKMNMAGGTRSPNAETMERVMVAA